MNFFFTKNPNLIKKIFFFFWGGGGGGVRGVSGWGGWRNASMFSVH